MKKTLLLLLLPLLMISCSKEDKAKSSIKKYIQENFNDPESYEPVTFGKLDTTHSTFDTSPEGVKVSKLMTEILDTIKKNQERYRKVSYNNALSAMKYSDWYSGSKYDRAERKQMDSLHQHSKELLAKYDKLEADIKPKRKAFKSEFNGYKIEHKLRAKNAAGAKVLQTWMFMFDKDMKVIDAGDINRD